MATLQELMQAQAGNVAAKQEAQQLERGQAELARALEAERLQLAVDAARENQAAIQDVEAGRRDAIQQARQLPPEDQRALIQMYFQLSGGKINTSGMRSATDMVDSAASWLYDKHVQESGMLTPEQQQLQQLQNNPFGYRQPPAQAETGDQEQQVSALIDALAGGQAPTSSADIVGQALGSGAGSLLGSAITNTLAGQETPAAPTTSTSSSGGDRGTARTATTVPAESLPAALQQNTAAPVEQIPDWKLRHSLSGILAASNALGLKPNDYMLAQDTSAARDVQSTDAYEDAYNYAFEQTGDPYAARVHANLTAGSAAGAGVFDRIMSEPTYNTNAVVQGRLAGESLFNPNAGAANQGLRGIGARVMGSAGDGNVYVQSGNGATAITPNTLNYMAQVQDSQQGAATMADSALKRKLLEAQIENARDKGTAGSSKLLDPLAALKTELEIRKLANETERNPYDGLIRTLITSGVPPEQIPEALSQVLGKPGQGITVR